MRKVRAGVAWHRLTGIAPWWVERGGRHRQQHGRPASGRRCWTGTPSLAASETGGCGSQWGSPDGFVPAREKKYDMSEKEQKANENLIRKPVQTVLEYCLNKSILERIHTILVVILGCKCEGFILSQLFCAAEWLHLSPFNSTYVWKGSDKRRVLISTPEASVLSGLHLFNGLYPHQYNQIQLNNRHCHKTD